MLTRQRELIWEMTRREFSDRYAGQALGIFWAVGHPLMLMLVYFFLFGVIFKTRLGGTPGMPLDYTAYFLAGLIPWLACQEALMKSSTAITGHANLVKQVVFPVEVLPLKSVIAALLTQMGTLVLLLVYILLKYHRLPSTLFLFPVLLFFQFLALTGIGYGLSLAGAYFRDLKDILQVTFLMAVYLMPVFYLPAWVPALFKPILIFNPFSSLIWCYQDIFYFERVAHPGAWIFWMVFSVFSFYGGYRLFQKVKHQLGGIL